MKKKQTDPLKKIKHIAYCMSQLGSGDLMVSDFVRFAKFQLCVINKRLMKDPIWDLYTTEEILVEFYAHQFETNEKFLKEFESEIIVINGELDDFDTWAQREIQKNDLEREKTLGSMEERVSFNPTEFLGEE